MLQLHSCCWKMFSWKKRLGWIKWKKTLFSHKIRFQWNINVYTFLQKSDLWRKCWCKMFAVCGYL